MPARSYPYGWDSINNRGRSMEQVNSSRTIANAMSSFHLAHVRSLLKKPKNRGGATDRVPENARRTYSDRVAGHVMVVLPGGGTSRAKVFEALTPDEVPAVRVAHGVLDGVTYWFRCSPPQGKRGDVPCHRAYFLCQGKWLFFFTDGEALPFGAVVEFSRSVGEAGGEMASAA
jgi:hypothetical protein